MKYKILLNAAPYLLESEVNKYLEEGWELAGGLSVTSSSYLNERDGFWDTRWEYTQAITLGQGKEPKP